MNPVRKGGILWLLFWSLIISFLVYQEFYRTQFLVKKKVSQIEYTYNVNAHCTVIKRRISFPSQVNARQSIEGPTSPRSGNHPPKLKWHKGWSPDSLFILKILIEIETQVWLFPFFPIVWYNMIYPYVLLHPVLSRTLGKHFKENCLLQKSDKGQIFYWSSQTCTRVSRLFGCDHPQNCPISDFTLLP